MRWSWMFTLRLSELTARRIQEERGLPKKASEESLRQTVLKAVERNIQEEKDIEAEAEKILRRLEAEGQRFEAGKMRPLLKAQIAKKRGFTL